MDVITVDDELDPASVVQAQVRACSARLNNCSGRRIVRALEVGVTNE